MADFDSQQPVRSEAANNETRIAKSDNTVIDPATEGTLSTVSTNVADIETELLDQGTSLDSLVTDAAAIETELLDQGTSLDSMVTDLAAIETELLDQGTTLDNIASALGAGTGVNTHDYNTASAIAAGASNTHSFSPAADFLLQDIYYAASGQMKVEIQWGVTASETTKTVGFTTKGNLTGSFKLRDPQLIQTTDTIKIIRTNTEPGQAQDLYSSIHGIDA